jgi:ribosome-associated translation inhibitor RaiA
LQAALVRALLLSKDYQEEVPAMQTTTSETDNIPFPYDIRFVDSETSEAVRFQVEDHLRKLAHHYDRITYCSVAIGIPHKRGTARFFSIHIVLDVPGKRIAVSRDHENYEEHTQIRTVVNDAFHKLTRQLEDFLRVRSDRKVEVRQAPEGSA